MFKILLFVTVACTMPCYSFDRRSIDYPKRIARESARVAVPPKSRIIEGENGTIKEYPFAVSLQNNGTFFGHEVEHFCGGSIISERWIITSAQCALRMYVKQFQARAGSTYYYKNGTVYDVEGIVIHPKFDRISYDYDVGLVKLAKNIVFNDAKRPIKLPRRNVDVPDAGVVRVIGWGVKSLLGPVSDELRYADLPKISTTQCQSFYTNHDITSRMFCIYLNTVGPCVGDSGSAALYKNTLVGVISWRDYCMSNYPTALTNVAELVDWITAITDVS